ncbi:Rap1a/Tai family immunity protein [Pseudomonas sivasensis]|uniref:Rap1a/Tai family immunity protein n=1 Tax=Pseudomonas sivasensis TaxID=1880678 RepID=UPI003CFDB362
MKARVAAVGLMGIIASGTASANGLSLLAQCHEAIKAMDGDSKVNMLGVGSCFGMIEGVRNTMQILNSKLMPDFKTCFPTKGITNEQGIRIVVKFLEDNPAQLDQLDTTLTIMAYRAAYPCK